MRRGHVSYCFACAFLFGILHSGQTIPVPETTTSGSFGAFGAPTSAPAPFGATASTTVPPNSSTSVGGFGGYWAPMPAPAPIGATVSTPVASSAGFGGFYSSTATPTTATTSSTFIEPLGFSSGACDTTEF